MRICYFVSVISLLFNLNACGQKGPLVLPETAMDEKTAKL
jgi:predicted small lipoprotein YifL